MTQPPERRARLVLLGSDGAVLGSLPPFTVATPWWQDMAPVVSGARHHYGIDVTVLRLLEAEHPIPHGGLVTYLAQTTVPVEAQPWFGSLDEHPLRLPYARVGGPAADLAWTDQQLSRHGLERSTATQIRTWNLSSLWRVEAGRAYWLKVVPPFFAHEGALLRRLAGGPVPEVLAHDGVRMLLMELPGDDLHDAIASQLQAMVSLVVDLQVAWRGRDAELLALGLPDFRADALTRRIAGVLERTASDLSPAARRNLDRFVAHLPERWRAVAACGIPETLVHGDLHPGNFRGTASTLALLDWGDSCVGHPLLDQAAFLERVPQELVARVREHWHEVWLARVPGADPERAAALLAPVSAARQAVIYRHFLDHIEPSERPYHRADPARWLERAAAQLR